MNRPHIFQNQVRDFVVWLISSQGWTGKKCENSPCCLALLRPVTSGKWESIRHQEGDPKFIILSAGLVPMAHAWNKERRALLVKQSSKLQPKGARTDIQVASRN